jgi:hypothetical protein
MESYDSERLQLAAGIGADRDGPGLLWRSKPIHALHILLLVD